MLILLKTRENCRGYVVRYLSLYKGAWRFHNSSKARRFSFFPTKREGLVKSEGECFENGMEVCDTLLVTFLFLFFWSTSNNEKYTSYLSWTFSERSMHVQFTSCVQGVSNLPQCHVSVWVFCFFTSFLSAFNLNNSQALIYTKSTSGLRMLPSLNILE